MEAPKSQIPAILKQRSSEQKLVSESSNTTKSIQSVQLINQMETPTHATSSSNNVEDERVKDLLMQLRELSPDAAEKLISKVATTINEDAYDELVRKLSMAAEETVSIKLIPAKKKIEEMLKTKKRMGATIDEDCAAEKVYELEEVAVLSAVDELLCSYRADLMLNASDMKSKRLQKKREREEAAIERKRERESNKVQKLPDTEK